MKEMISICGLDCGKCPVYIATVGDDDDERKKIAKQWSQAMQKELKPEDINCVGCLKKEGNHFIHCSSCEIRICGMEKSLNNCGLCSNYSCGKLDDFLKTFPNPDARNNLEKIHSSG
ncbi:DUF3795 domain-containing protein [Spirochaetota bacterium]